MKFTIIALALISTTSAYLGEKTWSLRSLNFHKSDSDDIRGYNDYSNEAAEKKSEKPYRTNGDETWGAEQD